MWRWRAIVPLIAAFLATSGAALAQTSPEVAPQPPAGTSDQPALPPVPPAATAQDGLNLPEGMAIDRDLRERIVRELRSVIARGARYTKVCAALREPGTAGAVEIPDFPPLLDAHDRKFVEALRDYCEHGRMSIQNIAEDGKCAGADGLVIRDHHLRALEQLSAINGRAEGYVRFDCLRIQGALRIIDLKASRLTFNQVEAEDVLVAFTKVPHGIWFQATNIAKQLLLLEIEGDGAIEIQGGSIGDALLNPADNAPAPSGEPVFSAYGLKVNRIIVSDMRIAGDVMIRSSVVANDVLWSNTNRAGAKATTTKLDFDRLKAGGKIEIAGGPYTQIALDYAVARTIEIAGLNTESRLHVVDKIQATGLKADVLSIKNVEVAGLFIRTADVREVQIKYSYLSSIDATNSKLNALDLQDVVVDELDCTDCSIEQYVLLAGFFERRLSLQGAHIRNSLMLSHDDGRASWGQKAELNLTGLRVRLIEAFDDDLRVANEQPECPNQLVRVRLAGLFFEHWGGGRRNSSKAFTGGDIAAPASSRRSKNDVLTAKKISPLPRSGDSKVVQAVGLFERPPSSLTEWIRGQQSCWADPSASPKRQKKDATATTLPIVRTSGVESEAECRAQTLEATGEPTFDPQPFETFAQILERSGRPDKATELRIAKRDAQIAASCPDELQKLVFWLGRSIVGYGYDNNRALLWAAGLIALGMAFHLFGRRDWLKEPGRYAGWRAWLNRLLYSGFFSVDRLVPSLTLDKDMSEYKQLHPASRYYFYLHRVLGAIILTFAVAGLTGILK